MNEKDVLELNQLEHSNSDSSRVENKLRELEENEIYCVNIWYVIHDFTTINLAT